jgi:ABC-type transport system substrate-binding protein
MPLFPILANGQSPDRAVRRFVFSSVYRFNVEGVPVDDLAAAPCTPSPDLLDITCRLRSARFHDGSELTAADVAFTFQLRSNDACEELLQGHCVRNLASATAIDDHTVLFHLDRPDAAFLAVALPDVLIESRSRIEASYAAFHAASRDADPHEVAAEAGRLNAALQGGTADCDALAARAETVMTGIGLEPWSKAEFNLGANGQFNACGYAEYLARVLGDVHASLEREGIDAIAAAYRILDYQDDKPIGTGPWKVRSFEPGKEMTLDAFQGFYRDPPATRTLEVRLIRGKPEAVRAVRDHAVDWLLQPFAFQTPFFLSDGLVGATDGLTLAEYVDPSWFALYYNVRPGALFADPALRQAMELCINKEETVAAATRGRFVSIQSPIAPTSWAYDKTLKAPVRNVEAANRLIGEAGWAALGPDGIHVKNGRRLSAQVPVRDQRLDRLQFLRLLSAQVRDCGIEIEPLPLDDDVLEPLYTWPHHLPGTDRPWDLLFTGLIDSGTPDPGSDYTSFHSSAVSGPDRPTGDNLGGYVNPEVDALLDQALRTYELTERARLYRRIQELLATDRPMLFAWNPQITEARSDRLTSVDGPLSESSRTWWWELEKLVLNEAAR